jgi:hypothetical protein
LSAPTLFHRAIFVSSLKQDDMKKVILAGLLIISGVTAFSQDRFSSRDISINGFRNPSIGLEFRHHHVSLHGGYYLTSFTSGETTRFVKTGFTYWFFAVDKKEIPSSFYAGASYLRGLSREYDGKNALALEAGFRWMIWKGLNLRIGAIALAAQGQDLKINPTPGISYSFKF